MVNIFDGARIVLTGASSGIGLSLTRRLHAAGADILGIGRRTERELPADFPAITYSAVDLSGNGAATRLAAFADGLDWDTLDYLILNAGTGHHRPVGGESLTGIAETLQVNLVSPVQLVHVFAERLLAARGKVVLIGSVAHKGAVRFPVYAASKAALNGFARSVRSEWQGRIAVQILHPAATRTGMHERAGFDPGWRGLFFLKPDDVADVMVRQIARDRSPVTVGFRRVIRMKEARFLRGGR